LTDKQHSVFIYADDKTSKVGFDKIVRFEINAIDIDGELINTSSTDSITLDKNHLELFEGSSEKLTATVTPNSANVIWSSRDESIATVDPNGNVTALREGQAIITAKVENTELVATATVIVKNLNMNHRMLF